MKFWRAWAIPAPRSPTHTQEISYERKARKELPEEIFAEAKAWWTTEIIDIHPGSIAVRGYAIQDLIGKISFPQMIWLMLRGELPSAAQGNRLPGACLVARWITARMRPPSPSPALPPPPALSSTMVMASAVNVLGDVHGGAGQQCMELFESRRQSESRSDLPARSTKRWLNLSPDHGKIIPGLRPSLASR